MSHPSPRVHPAGSASARPGELTSSVAPLPQRKTLQRRTSLAYQALRFVRVNLRMVKMIRRSHAS